MLKRLAAAWLRTTIALGDSLRGFRGSEFRRDQPLMNPGEVIRWWEGRRFFFNSVVGCTGVITCVLLFVCAFTADSTVGEPIGMPRAKYRIYGHLHLLAS